ncbi:MAG: radical SAM protein [Clostridia bacterium]|nr:radical SAM protein [Clostridia bacterium]
MESVCTQCPRQCGIDRAQAVGFCGAPWEFRVARAALHPWEEPPISGTRGSGTVFFSGCNLRCVFCQNREISREIRGKKLDADALAAVMLSLRDKGAHNINLVTPTPYALQLIPVLEKIKPTLGIPVVYNCGGYESVDTLRALEGLVDVWLPDVKYHSPALSLRYSAAEDYYTVAETALDEMLRQAGNPQFDTDGMLSRGVIVRHLVLPGCRADSIALLKALAKKFGTDRFLLSLMSQYTPQFADRAYPSLCRRVTTFEYESVATVARQLGFDGYFQERDSATADYTPDFGQMQI